MLVALTFVTKKTNKTNKKISKIGKNLCIKNLFFILIPPT